jgi:quercetin dioxygenase-like cupin family protein
MMGAFSTTLEASMKQPKLIAAIVVGGLMAVGVLGVRGTKAQPPGFNRVMLQKQDLSVTGHEVVVARGDFQPGGTVPKHTHPGEEVGYVLEGEVVMELEGKPPQTLKAGQPFFIPAGTVHAARNGGKGPAKILATYVVEKGKPLATLVTK